MEVEDKNTQLREKVTQIDRQQREIQALMVGIHFTLEKNKQRVMVGMRLI